MVNKKYLHSDLIIYLSTIGIPKFFDKIRYLKKDAGYSFDFALICS